MRDFRFIRTLKLIAAATVFFFTANTLGYGQVPWNLPATAAQSSQPFIIHIQDAHANPEAQENIAGIIRHLHEREGIDTVFFEAGDGALDERFLHFTPDEALNQKIAAKLAEMGEMTYADLVLFGNGNKIKFLGIENPALYGEEIRVLKEVLSHESEIIQLIDVHRRKLEHQWSGLGNRDLAALLRHELADGDKSEDIASSLNFLDQLSQKYLARNLRSPKEQIEFPNLGRLLHLKTDGAAVNVEKARGEWERVRRTAYGLPAEVGVKRLEQHKNVLEDIETLFRRTPYAHLGGQAERRTVVNPRFLIEQLYAQLKPTGFRFQQFPHFSRYMKQLIFRHEIQAEGVMDEVARWQRLLLDRLARTPAEKAAVRAAHEFVLYRNLLTLKLNREEWGKIKKREAFFVKREAQDEIRLTLHSLFIASPSAASRPFVPTSSASCASATSNAPSSSPAVSTPPPSNNFTKKTAGATPSSHPTLAPARTTTKM